jgi:hypothetical protein
VIYLFIWNDVPNNSPICVHGFSTRQYFLHEAWDFHNGLAGELQSANFLDTDSACQHYLKGAVGVTTVGPRRQTRWRTAFPPFLIFPDVPFSAAYTVIVIRIFLMKARTTLFYTVKYTQSPKPILLSSLWDVLSNVIECLIFF